ncbi:hypothetical protein IJG72_03330 [bacterium]|nr:hypothetical protein [bacterium]
MLKSALHAGGSAGTWIMFANNMDYLNTIIDSSTTGYTAGKCKNNPTRQLGLTVKSCK